MSKYETYIDEVESGDELSELCVEKASDALAFVQALHTMFQDNGVDLPAEPDVDSLENVIDGILGELSAACIFLSEDSFDAVPDMLRKISSSFTQNIGEEVPTVITKGFSRLADRIKATRVQGQQMEELISTN